MLRPDEENQLETLYRHSEWQHLREVTTEKLVMRVEDPGDAAWLLYYYASTYAQEYPERPVACLERAILLDRRGYCSMNLSALANLEIARAWYHARNLDRAREPLTAIDEIIRYCTRQHELAIRTEIMRGRLCLADAEHYLSFGDAFDGKFLDRPPRLMRQAMTHFTAGMNGPEPPNGWPKEGNREYWRQYARHWLVYTQALVDTHYLEVAAADLPGHAGNESLPPESDGLYVLNRETLKLVADPTEARLSEVRQWLDQW
jgi:hypothetical protein